LLLYGEQFPIIWTKSEYADWYLVEVNLYYVEVGYKDTFTYTTDTSLIILDGWLGDSGTLVISVYAGNGPKNQVGSSGNIDGATGFWVGIFCVSKYVTVGSIADIPSRPMKQKHQMIMKEYLKQIAAYNKTAAEILNVMK